MATSRRPGRSEETNRRGTGNRRVFASLLHLGIMIERTHDVCFADCTNHRGLLLSDPYVNETHAVCSAREEKRHVRRRACPRLPKSTAIRLGHGSGRVQLALAGLMLCLVAALPAGLRAANRRLSGTIATSSGDPVPNAQVSVKNTATSVVQTVTSKQDGSYALTGVAPGVYQVSATAPGFSGASLTVTVGADNDQTANLVLLPQAGVAEAVKQGAQSACCSTMNQQAVGQLPLNGRSSSDVAALEPGVTKARTQAPSSGPYGYGTQMTIFGGRPRQNDSRLDGISVNDYANGPLGNAIGFALGVDALEQLSVLTRNDQAEYGRSSGGYISSSTRSGTDSFHGSAFEYIRNSALDAANFFDIEKPPFRRNQFGGSLGGPIWKGHTYFFADYEGIRQSQGVTNRGAVPSEAAREGNLSTGTITVDPVIKSYLDAFYPLPNAGLLGAGDTGVRISAGQKVTPGNHFTTRIDHKISDKDALYGVYMFDVGTVTQPDPLDIMLTQNDSRTQFLTIGETHTFSPELLNSFRVGIYRMVANSGGTLPENNPNVSDPSFGAVPGLNAPEIDVPGLTPFQGGLGARTLFHFHWTSIQAYDDLSTTRGAHSLKFGVAIERMRDNYQVTSDPTGVFAFNSLVDFLTNKPYSLSVSIPGKTTELGIRQTVAGVYVQDDWRLRPNFSLSLGLRYEMATVPTEAQNQLTAVRQLTDPEPHLGSPLFANPTLRNFEPRVGFAWDPFSNGKTVVSAGFGVFDVLPLPYVFQFAESSSAPFVLAPSLIRLPEGSFPTEAYNIAASSTNAFRYSYIEPNPHRNYVMQYNFTIQRQLPFATNIKIGYVGSRGVHHITRLQDANIVFPTPTADGNWLWPSPAGSGMRLNPYTGRMNATFWEGDSYYSAMVLQMTHRIGPSSQIVGSYTLGKSIDTSSGPMGANEYSNATIPLWFDLRLNRGLSDFNLTQDLKIIYSYEIPGLRGFAEPLGWATNGWRIGGIFEATSGVPFTPGFGGDPLGVLSTDTNLDVPNLVGGPGCASMVNPGDLSHYINTACFGVPNPITLRGNLGRNTLIGPKLINLDFSLFKNNYIKSVSDSFNVQFRAEFFNVLNHPSFDAPLHHKNIFDTNGNPISSAGLITSTATTSRQIQFALKFIW
jgi:hypothetical protein